MTIYLALVAALLLMTLMAINGYEVNKRHRRGFKDPNVILAFVAIVAAPGLLAIGVGVEKSSMLRISIGAACLVVGVASASVAYFRSRLT